MSASPRLFPDTPLASRRILALVVDDEATNRLVLRGLLGQMGYAVVEAVDGVQAVEAFSTEQPDIVFMDIMMPGMDGYEATRRIKALCPPQRFVPVIVLTAMSDEQALAKCIHVGGDDVLTKPVDTTALKSKIHAMLRIRDLHRQVGSLYARIRNDEQIAEQVFSRAVMADNIALDKLQMLLRPASIFSGDTVLTTHGPGGDLHLLLGDFTGHGLAAAIGALPTAEIFRAMAAKGFDGRAILAAINEKLNKLLPDDRFLAACYVHIPRDLTHATVFNCGLPEVLIVDGESGAVKQRIAAQHFPLGIEHDFPLHEICVPLMLHTGDKIIMYSDGIIESRNEEEEEFGPERLEQAIAAADPASIVDHVLHAVVGFTNGKAQDDDITLVVVPFTPDVFGDTAFHGLPKMEITHAAAETRGGTNGRFRVAITLHGQQLRSTELVPMLMNQLHELHLPEAQYSEVFTVLTELYLNALDHGVLGLGSQMKERVDGFAEYFAERALRLNDLQEGYVAISVQGELRDNGGRLVVAVEDSGPGFDFHAHSGQELLQANTGMSGRGIGLVRALSQSLRYLGSGNQAEAVYVWRT